MEIPNDYTVDEVLVILTQNFILEIINSPNKPDNFDGND